MGRWIISAKGRDPSTLLTAWPLRGPGLVCSDWLAGCLFSCPEGRVVCLPSLGRTARCLRHTQRARGRGTPTSPLALLGLELFAVVCPHRTGLYRAPALCTHPGSAHPGLGRYGRLPHVPSSLRGGSGGTCGPNMQDPRTPPPLPPSGQSQQRLF